MNIIFDCQKFENVLQYNDVELTKLQHELSMTKNGALMCELHSAQVFH